MYVAALELDYIAEKYYKHFKKMYIIKLELKYSIY